MEKTRLSKFKWFWAWNDDKEEAWLRKMAQEGWHLARVNGLGFYTFGAGQPRDVIYRLDYRTATKMDRAEYLQLFRDAGWEHLGEMAGWQYFRKPADAGGAPDIYSDVESKIDKYRRLIGFLILPLSVLTVMTATLDPPAWPGWVMMRLIMMVPMVLMTYGMIRLILRISQLKRP